MIGPATDYFAALAQDVRAHGGPPALALLEEAIAEHPGDPRPLLLLAAELATAGLTDPAEAAYVTALQVAPDLEIARFQLGLLQLTSGRPSAALASWAPLERLGERDPLCCFKRGLEALVLGAAPNAREWILAGIAANTSNEPLNRDMRGVLERMERAGLRPPGTSSGAPSAEPPEEAQTAADAAEHFLVSAYGPRSEPR